MKLGRFLLIVVAAVAIVGLGVVAWFVTGSRPMAFAGGQTVTLGAYKGPSPTGVPADFAGADPIARGQYLARAADCQACHTAKGGAPFAGGLAFNLPFGSIWSPNITPTRKPASAAGPTPSSSAPCTGVSTTRVTPSTRPCRTRPSPT